MVAYYDTKNDVYNLKFKEQGMIESLKRLQYAAYEFNERLDEIVDDREELEHFVVRFKNAIEFLSKVERDFEKESWKEGKIMSRQKLDVINSMKIVEVDAFGGELIYAIVDYNQENIEKLKQVVPDVDEYLNNAGDPDGTKESIDITVAAFQYAGADYYAKGKFWIDKADLSKIEVLEAEVERLKLLLRLKN